MAPLRHSRDGAGHVSGSSHSKRSVHGAGGSSNHSASSNHKQSHRSKGSNSGQHHDLSTSTASHPPELPRRGSSTSSSSSGSVWSKPLGQHVEAFFSRKSGGNQNNKSLDGSSQLNGAAGGKKDQSSSNSAASTTVNLIKRFTNMKRSKSPVNTSSTTYSMDNPVFEDCATSTSNGSNATIISAASKRNTIHLSHPVHVRSGSCPSQLLQSLPIDINLANSSMHATKKSVDTSNSSNSYMFGSQRVKGHKERPTLHGCVFCFLFSKYSQNSINNFSFHRMRNNLENNRLRGIPDAASGGVGITTSIQQQSQNTTGFSKQIINQNIHRKSASLDAATISSQIGNTSMAGSGSTAIANKNKTYAYNER